MKFEDGKYYIVADEVRFRRDRHRCLFYTVDEFFYAPDNLSVIHPWDVVLILLFDGTRTIADVKRDYDYLFDRKDTDVHASLEMLSKQLHDFDFIVPVEHYDETKRNEIAERFNAEDFLIPVDQIFLDYKNLRIDAPLSVNFNVTTNCGFSCRYCYHPLSPVEGYLPLDRIDLLCKDLKAAGVESILLTGGDPMLRPDIDEVMECIHRNGVFYTLSTKSIISKERLVRLNERAGLDRIQISLDSFDPAVVHDLIGTPSDYVDRVVQMVRYMHEIGMDVRFKAVLTRLNADGIEDYLDRCAALDIRHIQIASYGRSGYRHDDSLFPTQEQFDNASKVIDSWRARHPEVSLVGGNFKMEFTEHKREEANSFDEMMKNRVICNAGRFSLLILPNGEVFICEHLAYDKKYVLGDLRTQSLKDVWDGEGIKSWLAPPPREKYQKDSPCYSCKDEYYNYCHTHYSRCLRFCREYAGDVDAPDCKCPLSEYEKIRII